VVKVLANVKFVQVMCFILTFWEAGSSVQAGLAFVDDFEDGDYADGNPVTWTRYSPPFDQGNVEVQNGSLVLTPPNSGPPPLGIPNRWETDVFVVDQLYHDVNLWTQVRALVDAPTP
jgi:hypothetical protein